MSKPPLYILDSYGLIYRAYYAFINRPLINERQQNVSAVFGFFRNFLRILKDYKPEFTVAALDSKTPTFRHTMYDQYKATRQKTPEDLHAQIPIIEEVLDALGVHTLRSDGYEADDIIATLAERCKKEGRECRILSGDKDLMQLVGDGTSILKPDKNGGWELIDAEGVKAEWGVPPKSMLDLLSLTGDASDNIPGVAGVGDKTALKLLGEYGSLDGIYENAEKITGAIGTKIRNGKESAYFSKKLIALYDTVPIDSGIEQCCSHAPDYAAAAKRLFEAGVPAVAKSYAEEGGVSAVKSIQSQTTGSVELNPQQIQNTVSIPDDDTIPVELKENSGKYRAVTALEELSAIIDAALTSGETAFDCETDSLQTHRAKLVGFSFSAKEGDGVYIPLILPESGTLLESPLVKTEDAITQLNRLFSNPNMLIITHNGKFDYEVLMTNGLAKPRCRFADTMIAAWILNPERASFSLEALSQTKLGLKTTPYVALVPKAAAAKGMTFADVPLETAAKYAAEDADLTWQLWQIFKSHLKTERFDSLFYNLEMPLLPILADMESAGIHIEKQKLAEYAIELTTEIAVAKKDIFALVGHEFNISSTKQLQEVLFTERKLVPSKKTKTGFSTDTAVLEELAALDPVPKKILEYRSLTKLLSTYVEAIPLLADKNNRVHTSFMQTGTATGRLSSRDPNLQNIPIREEAGRRIREAFTAKDGFMLISADYSQIELVILAHLSGDKNLQRAFNEGTDVHKTTASLIFGIPPQEVTPDMRRTAKTINFGVMYGMSPFRLSNELGISRTQAKDFINAYFATYSGIQDFIHRTVEGAEKSGYVETILGRRRYIQAINSKNKTEKAGAERIAVNTPIQGSAADIVKTAMISLAQAIEAEQNAGKLTGTRLLLQVHDELILECAEADTQAVCTLVKTRMEGAAMLSLPLRVSVESGKNWGMFH